MPQGFSIPAVFLLVCVTCLIQSACGRFEDTSRVSPRPSSGRLIVHLDRGYSVDDIERHVASLASTATMKVHHRYDVLMHGAAVSGVSKEQLMTHPGVIRVVPDTLKRITTYSWGLDRLDQKDLPLDNAYRPTFRGEGVDVYVVDTGLDTTHIEFAPNEYGREVKNIFVLPGDVLSGNTDGEGHGTHVAGTIGGNSVGVSAGANIYGLRVLNDEGSGETSGIVAALEEVGRRVKSSGRPSIVSMSLGGPCETDDCSKDSLVRAVEALVAMGVHVSVAAGNDGANACFGSPNSAPHAVVTGALSPSDVITYWSNFGECVDIFAPGLDIVSACASVSCPADKGDGYVSMSGTSMACPHTSGVMAQILQRTPNATPADVIKTLSCDAAAMRALLDPLDSLSRNLLLQVPAQETDQDTCPSGQGCDDHCSGAGICAPAHKNGSTAICHCDKGVFGPTCSASIAPACSKSSLELLLGDDGEGSGWAFAKFALLDGAGNVVSSMIDTMAAEQEGVEAKNYCVPPGTYTFRVSKGLRPAVVAWQLCDYVGGAPFTGTAVVNAKGECEFSCGGNVVDFTLSSGKEEGWNGAYYAIYSEATGDQLFGGSASEEGDEAMQLCLSDGCYLLLFEHRGDAPKQVSMSVCGLAVAPGQIARICLAGDDCSASIVEPDGGQSCSADTQTAVAFNMFSPSLLGWGRDRIVLSRGGANTTVSSTHTSGLLESSSVCLDDGCYGFTARDPDGGDALTSNFWAVCGLRGAVPWTAQICVDSAYDLCYGLTGCPVIKSYSKTSYSNWFFVYDDDGALLEVDNVHAVHEMCELDDGCYNFFVGAGISSDDVSYSSVDLCGTKTTLLSRGRFCVSDSALGHNAYGVAQSQCSVERTEDLAEECANNDNGGVLNPIVMISQSGSGWGRIQYSISDEAGRALYRGSLANGDVGVDYNCFTSGSCYTISTSRGQQADDVLFIMCGLIGDAPLDDVKFCVSDTGCQFDLSGDSGGGGYGGGYGDDDGSYGGSDDDSSGVVGEDDDFPSDGSTRTPAAAPASKSRKPSLSAALDSNSVQVVNTVANVTMLLASMVPLNKIDVKDVEFVTNSVRRALDLADISLFDVHTNPSFGTSSKYSVLRSEMSASLGYQKEVSCAVTVALVLGDDGQDGAVESLKHTLSFALSTGLLQRLVDMAVKFQRGASRSPVDAAYVLSVAVISQSGPVAQSRDSIAGVSGDYDKIWSSDDVYSAEGPPGWLIGVLSSVGTLIGLSVCYFAFWCWSKRRAASYDRVDGNDADETTSTTSPLSNAVLPEFLGNKRSAGEGEEVTVTFNDRSGIAGDAP